ncbi:unnamed protein product [Amoebophrya sp. A120]|nr:unnamed protein product [Amoebophrya sp. A120]|eukprot:GSA120T00010555001.1
MSDIVRAHAAGRAHLPRSQEVETCDIMPGSTAPPPSGATTICRRSTKRTSTFRWTILSFPATLLYQQLFSPLTSGIGINNEPPPKKPKKTYSVWRDFDDKTTIIVPEVHILSEHSVAKHERDDENGDKEEKEAYNKDNNVREEDEERTSEEEKEDEDKNSDENLHDGKRHSDAHEGHDAGFTAVDFFTDIVDRHAKDTIEPKVYRGVFLHNPEEWTDENIRKVAGKERFDQVETEKKETRNALPMERMKISKFLDLYDASHTNYTERLAAYAEKADSTRNKKERRKEKAALKKQNLYAVAGLANHPKTLQKLLKFPKFLECNVFLRKTLREAILWWSSGGTESVIHNDGDDNLNCAIDGSKEFMIWEPAFETKFMDSPDGHPFYTNHDYGWLDVEQMCHRYDDPKHHEYENTKGKHDPARFISHEECETKFKKAYGSFAGRISASNMTKKQYTAWKNIPLKRYRTRIEPGDCLFIPKRWLHVVKTIGEAQRTINVNIWFARLLADTKKLDQENVETRALVERACEIPQKIEERMEKNAAKLAKRLQKSRKEQAKSNGGRAGEDDATVSKKGRTKDEHSEEEEDEDATEQEDIEPFLRFSDVKWPSEAEGALPTQVMLSTRQPVRPILREGQEYVSKKQYKKKRGHEEDTSEESAEQGDDAELDFEVHVLRTGHPGMQREEL